MPEIILDRLVKRYAAGADPAVRDVSLTVPDGAFMCLLGPSGCGKTTILRMLAGLEATSDGTIAVGGQVLDSRAAGVFVPPEKRGLGLVFQSYALWPHMTVARNIEFGLRLRRLGRAERQMRVTEVMAKLRIDGLGDRYPAQLSGGQQQRVALARMLVVNPGVLLLDEPLSNLDATLRLKMREELSRLHREYGTTIVFVTHDQWEAMTLATRIAVMSRGEVQQVGRPDDIYDRPANRFVAEFIGNPPITMIATGTPLARALANSGVFGMRSGDVDRAAALGLRPEGVEIVAEAGDSRVPVTLRSVLPTGGGWILEMDHHGTEGPEALHAVTHIRPRYRAGARVYAGIRPGSAHLFDATGRRMAPSAASAFTPALS